MSKQIAASQGAGLSFQRQLPAVFRRTGRVPAGRPALCLCHLLVRARPHEIQLPHGRPACRQRPRRHGGVPFGGIIADRISRKVSWWAPTRPGRRAPGRWLRSSMATRFPSATLYAAHCPAGPVQRGIFSPAAARLVPGIVGRQPMSGGSGGGAVRSEHLHDRRDADGRRAVQARRDHRASSLVNAASIPRRRRHGVGLRVSRPAGELHQRRAGAGARIGSALRQFAGELPGGLRQVRKDRTVFSLLLVNTAFTLVAVPIPLVYLPYLFNVILGASPVQAAFPLAATWAGIILGRPQPRASSAGIARSRSSPAGCWPSRSRPSSWPGSSARGQ